MKTSINQLFSRLLKKDWTPEKIAKYVGVVRSCHFTYAADPALRAAAASGGSITALLAYLLESGEVQGALVCRGIVQDGKYLPEFFIAHTRQQLLQSQGSKYTAVHFSSRALPLIKAFPGRLAVVALPCDITLLHTQRQQHPELDEKIALSISLFCGHNSEPELTEKIIARLRPQGSGVTEFRHREGHWRGSLRAVFSDGSIQTRPFSYFSDYQNLYFFCQKKCHLCADQTGYNADVSAGDIWSMRMKDNPIKHTALLGRTPRGEEIVARALEAGYLVGKPEPVSEVCEGQARTMPFHHNVSARTRAGKWLGLNIPDKVHEPVSLADFLLAWMVLSNEKMSRSLLGQKVIFALPRPLLKAYLYFMKFLESF